MLLQRGRIIDKISLTEPDRKYPPPENCLPQSSRYRFDFGKFRHKEERTFKIAQRHIQCSSGKGPTLVAQGEVLFVIMLEIDIGVGAACRGGRPYAALSPQLLLVVIRIRRMLRDHHWILLQHFECDFHGLFELPVVPRRNRRGIVFHFNIRRDSAVLHFPFAL